MAGAGVAVRQGVPFWDEKRDIMRRLLSAYSDKDLVEMVCPDLEDGPLVDSILASIGKWRKHRPTKRDGPRVFFDRIAVALGCRPGTTGVMLVDSTLEEFIRFLPPEKQEVARMFAPAHPPAPVALVVPSEDVDLSPPKQREIWLLCDGPSETITAGIQAGRVDQRHYYLTPDAAETWNALVRAEAYPTYDQCKLGLRALFADQAWIAALEHSRPTTPVMLAGGGAPTKDLVVLRNLLERPYLAEKHIEYFLVDISLYMLTGSLWWLEESMRTIRGHDRVTMRLVNSDVLNLKRCRRHFRHDGNVMFAMTGGTIGNLSEGAFFRSLDTVSEDGDLLIVSADTHDDIEQSELERQLTHKYGHAEMHNFIAPAVRILSSESERPESLRAALKRVRVSLSGRESESFSDVPDSCSVTLTLQANGKDVTLLTSTRYQSSRLVAFAKLFGWELVCKVPSPTNPHYLQFGFRRKKTEGSGNASFRASVHQMPS